jgi:hypothetical protein
LYLHTFNGRRVGSTLIDGYFLGHVAQVDGVLQKPTRRSEISLGRRKSTASPS